MFSRSKPENLPSPEVLNQKVTQTLHLSPDDLAANRQGKLSPSQCSDFEALMKQGSRAALIAAPLIVLLAVGSLAFRMATQAESTQALSELMKSDLTIPVIGIGGSLLLYLIVIGIGAYRASRLKPADFKVQSVTGPVKVSSAEVTGSIGQIVKVSGGYNVSYLVEVGHKKIYSINPAVADAFVKGGQYRVYFVKSSGAFYFVSAEAA